MGEKDTLIVLGASYDSLADAEADYEAVKDLYDEVGVGHTFDAAVSSADPTARSRSSPSTSSPPVTRPGPASPSGFLAAILPGIGLGVGAAVGAGVGAVTGHIKGGMSNDDLRELGAVLDRGEAGLVVLYATNMADQIAASIKAENRYISEAIDADADDLAKQLRAADGN
jgi:uncharacterized membrane protein